MYCHRGYRGSTSHQRAETTKRDSFSQKAPGVCVMIRHGRDVPSECPKQKHFSPETLKMATNTGGNASV